MQNLPIIAILPTPPAPHAAVADNGNATPPSESFNSVLARQRSSASTDTSAQGSKPSAAQAAAGAPATHAARDGSATTNNASNKNNVSDSEAPAATATAATAPVAATPAPSPDTAAAALSGDAAAALLSSSAATGNTSTGSNTLTDKKAIAASPSATPDTASALSADPAAAALPVLASISTAPGTSGTPAGNKKEKATAQAAAPQASTLPSDMLAMMMPAIPAASNAPTGSASSANSASDPLSTPGKPAQALSMTATLTADAKPIAGNQGTAAVDAGQVKNQAFSAILGTASKDAINTASPDGGAPKALAAPAAPAAPDGLPQNGATIISAANSGNAPVQAAQAAINTPVSHDAWGKELGQKVTWMVTQHAQTAELHLNPPNLGPLNVVLKVNGDQATAQFTSAHAAVRDAVTQAMPQLRDMLANSGITLGNTTVNDQAPRDQQAWQSSQQQKGNAAGTMASGTESIAPSVVTRLSRHQGMVDTFA